MVNQFNKMPISENKGYDILINGRILNVDSDTRTKWEGFARWVEETALFNAIKEGIPKSREMKVDYYTIQAGDFQLNLSSNKDVNVAGDLPVEMLIEFYLNSPWITQRDNSIQKLLIENFGK